MQKDPIVASNYAKALLQAVKKNHTPLPEALDEAHQLRCLMETESRLRVFLEGPQFREEDKETIVNKVFQGQLSELFLQFLLLLLRHDRIEYLFDMLDEFELQVEHEQGITPGKVFTAIDLSDEEKQNLKDTLETSCGLKFDLRFKVDPKLIGGVKVTYKDILIDTTIETYLGELRQRLMKTRLAS